MIDFNFVQFIWEGGIRRDLEKHIRRDIANEFPDVQKTENIVSHIIFLGLDDHGPSITVHGKEGYPNKLWCRYQDVTEWETA